jgi:predicted nucleotidyltransferase
MGINEVLGDRREMILRTAERHGARNVRIFGSVARGDARPDSDIDLLVEMAPAHSPFFPGGLIADLQDMLGRPVHVVTERALHQVIRERVVREAVAL